MCGDVRRCPVGLAESNGLRHPGVFVDQPKDGVAFDLGGVGSIAPTTGVAATSGTDTHFAGMLSNGLEGSPVAPRPEATRRCPRTDLTSHACIDHAETEERRVSPGARERPAAVPPSLSRRNRAHERPLVPQNTPRLVADSVRRNELRISVEAGCRTRRCRKRHDRQLARRPHRCAGALKWLAMLPTMSEPSRSAVPTEAESLQTVLERNRRAFCGGCTCWW
jgi:hypothetical protein